MLKTYILHNNNAQVIIKFQKLKKKKISFFLYFKSIDFSESIWIFSIFFVFWKIEDFEKWTWRYELWMFL